MKTENINANSEAEAYSDFRIDEKDFRMWVFDRHNTEDSAIFEPVRVPDKNKILEQIPSEYTEIRNFISESCVDELALELTEKRKRRRKELEQEYIREKHHKKASEHCNQRESEADDFDIKSANLRNALLQTYENTDAKISFSSMDFSQIKKDKTNRQKQDSNKIDARTDATEMNVRLKKYKTANICLISIIFVLLIFFVGQRYIERNGNDLLAIIHPETDSIIALQEPTTEAATLPAQESETEAGINEATTLQQNPSKEASTAEATTTKKHSLININTASAKELQSLEGIGEVKAAKIIEYRETYGKFSSTRDILKVSGIGEKTYEKIKDKITVE